jgi:hypothetical protein
VLHGKAQQPGRELVHELRERLLVAAAKGRDDLALVGAILRRG